MQPEGSANVYLALPVRCFRAGLCLKLFAFKAFRGAAALAVGLWRPTGPYTESECNRHHGSFMLPYMWVLVTGKRKFGAINRTCVPTREQAKCDSYRDTDSCRDTDSYRDTDSCRGTDSYRDTDLGGWGLRLVLLAPALLAPRDALTVAVVLVGTERSWWAGGAYALRHT